MKAKYQRRQEWRAEIEACAWCGREFLKRSPHQKFCTTYCAKKAEHHYNQMENRVQQKIRIVVTARIPVYEHLVPAVGSIHDATEYTLPAGGKGCWIEMVGKQIILRQDEYRRIDDG